jgi:ARC6-like, IMS domain
MEAIMSTIKSSKVISTLGFFLATQFLQSCGNGASVATSCPNEPKSQLNKNNVEELQLTSGQITKSGQTSSVQPAGYRFSAKKGDVIKYQIKGKDMCAWLYDTESKILANTTLPKDGTYVLQIANISSSATFEIDIALGKFGESASPSQSSASSASPASTGQGSILTRDDASNLIGRWLEAKKSVFGPNYEKSRAEELMTGFAYERNITANAGDEESSVDYLSSNRMYYTYSDQRVHEIKDVREVSSSEVIVRAIVTEKRTLHNTQKGTTRSSSTEAARSCYQFTKVNGNWKISKTPELIQSCS